MKNKDVCRCLTVLLVTIIIFVNFLYPVKAEDEKVYAEYTIEEGDFLISPRLTSIRRIFEDSIPCDHAMVLVEEIRTG